MVTEVLGYVRSLNTGLPRSVYVLQSGLVVNALGNGAAAPFLVIYLHDVRGLSVAVAGLAGSTGATCALLASLAAGAAGDRYGTRRTMIVGLVLSTAAYVLYPLVRAPWHAFALASLAGTGIGTWLTMQSSMLAAITPPQLRHAAFAQQRVAANLGLGLGAAAAGLLVAVDDPQTFTRLFVFNAATFAIYACFVARLPAARPEPRGVVRTSGYRTVLADPALAAVALVTVLLVAAGVSLFASLFPVYAHNDVGVGERTIGVLFLLNSLLIIVLQLPVARAHEGHRRMRGLALTATAFAATWLLTLVAAGAGAGSATAVLVLAVLVFAVGECIYDAVQGPLVADLSGPRSRGRYMAVSGFAWQLGFIAGPGLGGLLLTAAGGWLWAAAAATCLVAAGAALGLERVVPTSARRTPSVR